MKYQDAPSRIRTLSYVEFRNDSYLGNDFSCKEEYLRTYWIDGSYSFYPGRKSREGFLNEYANKCKVNDVVKT